MVKEKLQIVLITYNRKEYLKKTLDTILATDSPIKNFDITILDNHSTDGTPEMIKKEYMSTYKNITHVINKINIGGNANICKAFTEYLNKEYIWVLADNDFYNFEAWNEIEQAINDDYDVIMTRKCDNIFNLFYKANLISSCIYKTKNITSDVVENMYDNIRFLFPHLAIMAKNLNDNNKIYIIKENIVEVGVNPNYKTTMIRGRNNSDIPLFRKNIYWSVGFFNSIELIKDRKKQIEIIENLRHYHKSLFGLFKSIMIYNKTVANNYFYNLVQIFRVLSFKQKIKFILAYLLIQFSLKNYDYWFIRYKYEWNEYLDKVNEQKYIDKLAKKLKNKKVILYGAGMFFDILYENYDLSKLNIIGISDKKFEKSNEKLYRNIQIIRLNELKKYEFSAILFTLKLYKKIDKSFKNSGIKQKTYSLIKKNNYYAMRS